MSKKKFNIVNIVLVLLLCLGFFLLGMDFNNFTTTSHTTPVNALNSAVGGHNRDTYYFDSNSAPVYLDIQDFRYKIDAEDAIAAWNSTNAFRFAIVNHPVSGCIIIRDGKPSEQKGFKHKKTTTIMDTQQYATNGHITKVVIRVNNQECDKFPQTNVINCFEHELGHSIGLNHVKSKSVMYPYNGKYPIEQRDVNAVNEIYS